MKEAKCSCEFVKLASKSVQNIVDKLDDMDGSTLWVKKMRENCFIALDNLNKIRRCFELKEEEKKDV